MAGDLVSSRPLRADDLRQVQHRLRVPLDHSDPDGEQITVFAREVRTVDNQADDLPYLAWFQGGPGFSSPRPIDGSGWLGRALKQYRVLLIDQRGTGLSHLVNRQTVAGLDDEAMARHLALFRADAIVEDAERLRVALGVPRWTTLGQSFGGFITTSYLSRHPASLLRSYITAGLPALDGGPDPVYRLTYAQTARRNDEFFASYPGAEDTAWEIDAHLATVEERLPTGERLTPERFRTLGIQLGSEGGFRELAYLLESAFVSTPGGRRLSDPFLTAAGASLSFAGNPLYAAIHEVIYSQGEATRWSAQRVRDSLPEFALDRTREEGPYRFTGEMVYPWHFAQDPALAPLRGGAEALAEMTGLPALYDPSVLADNEVPVAAAVFYDDMFVPRELSLQTAARIRGLKVDLSNHYQHDGLRRDGETLLDRLFALV